MKKLIFVLLSLIILKAQKNTNTARWRISERDSFENALLMVEEKNYKMALPIFENIYKNHSNEDFIKYMYGKCCLYRSDKHEDAMKFLEEMYNRNKKIILIEYDLARAYHLNYRFEDALSMVEKFLANKKATVEEKKDAQLLKKYILYAKEYHAKPTDAQIINIGRPVNSEDEEYVPVLPADESFIVFTYQGKKSKGGKLNAYLQPDIKGIYTEDVYASIKVNDEFTPPFPLDSINMIGHDAAVSISNDGSRLFIYRDMGDDHGDLYECFLRGLQYTKPQKLRGMVNTYAWEGHCSLSPDGRTLYFSSDRAGGYGGRDIYKATLMPDSTWGNVVNLGDSINTPLDDDAPFIHPDGITLFFSSKGRTSSGGYDIFKATMDTKDSAFKNVVNLGYPINSPDDDIYFVLNAAGDNAYYSSGKKGGVGLKDIYQIKTKFDIYKPAFMVVKGKVTFENKPVTAKIKVLVTQPHQKKYNDFQSEQKEGKYLISLVNNQAYKIIIHYDTFQPKIIDIPHLNLSAYKDTVINVNFEKTKPAPPPVVAKVDSSKVKKSPEPVLKNEPNTTQKKIMSFAEKYGDQKVDGLIFRVQIAAYRIPKNYTYHHLKGLGKVEKLILEDGVTRFTIGGNFYTLRAAWNHNIKVINAGQKDAFVTAIYKGKRVYLEQLEKLGIFKASENR
jgi:tetratricopeptide (TPR) repeat protein